MKNKVLKIVILTLMIINLIQIAVFANELTLNIATDKTETRVGDKIKVVVSWDQGMQAADFYLNYDSEKLKFIKADIEKDFINSEKEGQVKTAWFSADNTDKTQIEYTFKAKESGTAEFKTKINGGFATGELEIPNKYKNGKLTIEIAKQSLIIRILKVLVVVIIVVVILLIIKKNINKKTGGKKRYARTNKR